MPNIEIPPIANFDDAVLACVGERVDVRVYDDDPIHGPCQYASGKMVAEIVDTVLKKQDIAPNPYLSDLCVLVGQVVVATLAASPGFTAKFGGNGLGREPREIIEVNLRPGSTSATQAQVAISPEK